MDNPAAELSVLIWTESVIWNYSFWDRVLNSTMYPDETLGAVLQTTWSRWERQMEMGTAVLWAFIHHPFALNKHSISILPIFPSPLPDSTILQYTRDTSQWLTNLPICTHGMWVELGTPRGKTYAVKRDLASFTQTVPVVVTEHGSLVLWGWFYQLQHCTTKYHHICGISYRHGQVVVKGPFLCCTTLWQ